MVTTIGRESTVEALLKDLIQLDYDAIAAYDAAIERLDEPAFRNTLTGFRDDHRRHTQNLAPFLRELGAEVPTEGDAKQLLTKGKVVMANLLGDTAILHAMRTNEDDTNTAYGRAVEHVGLSDEARAVVRQNLADERRHCEWILTTLKTL